MDNLTGFPKGVVGTIARDTTNRPGKLRLKAPTFQGYQTTVGTNGERGSSTKRARRGS